MYFRVAMVLVLCVQVAACGRPENASGEAFEVMQNLSRSSLVIFRWNHSYCFAANKDDFRFLIADFGLSDSESVDIPNDVRNSLLHLESRGMPSFECDPRHWQTVWYSVYYLNDAEYSAVYLGDMGNGLLYYDSDMSVGAAARMGKTGSGVRRILDPWK